MLSDNSQPSFDAKARLHRKNKLKAEKFGRYFLISILIGIMIVFFNMVKIFLVPIILAAVFAAFFYPLYQRLLRLFRDRRGVGSLVTCLILLFAFLIPTYVIGHLVALEAIHFIQMLQRDLQDLAKSGDSVILVALGNEKIAEWLKLHQATWQPYLEEGTKLIGATLANLINKTSKGTFQLISYLFIMFFSMFYFFRDREMIERRLKYLSPLSESYEDAIIFRFLSISRATVRGTLVIALIQGGLGALTFWIFDIDLALFWGVVMVLLSVIPIVGPYLIMYPAAFLEILYGHTWQGIAIAAICAIVVSNIDNLLRPRLVGPYPGMHDLLVFFSTIGGISMFGVLGFIVGPVITAMFLTLLDIYAYEFKSQLSPESEIDAEPIEERVPTPSLEFTDSSA